MQMHQPSQNTLEVSGGQGTTRFGMDVNAHMFRILSDGLYSDKIGAVLREIACNAYDAHVMVGKQSLPIEVRLPGELSPTFYVKDWGPGLSEDQVRELYSTYGRSTKQGDENTTGGFGLGSKSPFAYTDQFTITSAYQGVMRTFIAHKDEEEPRITLMSTEAAPEDWQNGVMVSLVIRPEDFQTFRDRAVALFRWFEVRPSLVAGMDVEMLIQDNDADGIVVGDYRLFPSRNGKANGPGASVVMANVRYPLNLAELNLKPAEAARVVAFSPILKVPNGAVMPTPSREGMQYTRESKAYLAEAFGPKFWAALTQYVKQSVEDHLDKSFGELYQALKPLRQVAISWDYFQNPLTEQLKAMSSLPGNLSGNGKFKLGSLSDEEKRNVAYQKVIHPSVGRRLRGDSLSVMPQIEVEGFFYRARTSQVCNTVSRNPETPEIELNFDKPAIVVYEDCAAGKTLAKLFLRSLGVDEQGLVYVSDKDAKFTKKGGGSKILNELKAHAEGLSSDWYLSLGKVYSTSELKTLLAWEPSKSGPKSKSAPTPRMMRIAQEDVMTTDLATPMVEKVSDVQSVAGKDCDIVWFETHHKLQMAKVRNGYHRARYIRSVSVVRKTTDMPADVSALAGTVKTLREINPHLKSPMAKDVKFVVLSAAQVKRIRPDELGWTHVEKYLVDRLASLDTAPLLDQCNVPTDPALVDAYVTAGTRDVRILMDGRVPQYGWLFSVLGCTHNASNQGADPDGSSEMSDLAAEVNNLIRGTRLEEIRDVISNRIRDLPQVDTRQLDLRVALVKATQELANRFGLKKLWKQLTLGSGQQDEVLLGAVKQLKEISQFQDELMAAFQGMHPYYRGLISGNKLLKVLVTTYLCAVLDRMALMDHAKQASLEPSDSQPQARVKKHPRRVAADARQMALDLFADQEAVNQPEAA